MKNIDIIKISSSCIKCKDPNCNKYCKLGTLIPDILKQIELGNELEAAKLLFKNNPFPFVTGRLCDVDRKCFGHCIKNKINDSVKFYLVESYLGSKYIDLLFNIPNNLKDSNVAIIGGGITGLTVALRLLQNGLKPTIFEKRSNLGGVLINSLPDVRFKKDEIKRVINFISDNSNIYYNKSLGDNLFIEDLKDYEYIILATGASIERKTINDSLNAIYLLEHKEKINQIKNKNIVVIGGGNTAMDVSRVLNINNNVNILYRRNIDNAPASKKEINDTLSEGVVITECVVPVDVVYENDSLIGVKVEKLELYNDGSTRLNFRKTNTFDFIKCDLIVEATGSLCDYDYLKEVYPTIFNESSYIICNESYLTTIDNLYCGGDLYFGPKDFNSAIHSGEMIVKDILSRKE